MLSASLCLMKIVYEREEYGICLIFRDRRGGRLLGCYSESHEDDITQVCMY